jgi:hypothetical protein
VSTVIGEHGRVADIAFFAELTHRWTLRETDLYKYAVPLHTLRPMLITGQQLCAVSPRD